MGEARTREEVLAVLEARAAALARRPEVASVEPAGQGREWLVLARGDLRFALDPSLVLEVVRAGNVTPLPGVAAPLVGIAPFRGRILAVLDWGAAWAPPEHSGYLAVAAAGPMELAIRADRVEGLRRIPSRPAAPPPPASAGLGRWALGVEADGTLLVDAGRLLSDPSLVVEDHV